MESRQILPGILFCLSETLWDAFSSFPYPLPHTSPSLNGAQVI